MNYRARRNAKGLNAYTVSKELGVDYHKYLEVERGKRELEQEYCDKFQEVLRNAKVIKMEHDIKMGKVKQSVQDGSLKQLVKEMGYSGAEIGHHLKLTQCTISNNLNGKITGDETMERIYDFLHNPFNKKIKEELKENNKETNTKSKVETAMYQKEDKDWKLVTEDNKMFLTTDDNIKLTEQSIIDTLIEDNNRLKRQIDAYVKLIERL